MENDSLSSILNSFWKWIHLTPQLYAIASRTKDLAEYMFPSWDKMISEAINLVKMSPTDESTIDSILTAMAIDNETEDILDFIVQNCSESFINKLIEVGVVHCQPHARWQCAELIRRRRPSNVDKLLPILLSDSDDYVAKRAKNAMNSYNGDG